MAGIEFYRAANLESPAWSAAVVTPSDGADLPKIFARITALVGGNVAVVCSGGGTVTLAIAAGGVLPVFVDRVLSTGTTATGLVALYNS
ncbi:MAG: spike base protein, RCAP_Rcc01079 family [Paracoccaceae bacterium]